MQRCTFLFWPGAFTGGLLIDVVVHPFANPMASPSTCRITSRAPHGGHGRRGSVSVFSGSRDSRNLLCAQSSRHCSVIKRTTRGSRGRPPCPPTALGLSSTELQPATAVEDPLNMMVSTSTSSSSSSSRQFTNMQAPSLVADIAAISPACEEEPAPPLWPFLLPCSDSVGGNVFLGLAYGYLLLTAANLISEGSEELLEVLGPGLVGGLLLPALGAAPDALIILASGLRGTPEQAQEEVAVGLGVLAGSTILLATAAWGGCLLAGACDFDEETGRAKDRTLTRNPLTSPTTTGVTTDEQTTVGASLMAVSCLPFLVVQLPLIDKVDFGKEGPEFAFAGACVCFAGFVAYSAYQVASPWLQEKRLEEARLQLVKGRTISRAKALSRSWGGLINTKTGDVNVAAIDKLFTTFDSDGDQDLNLKELEALIIGLEVEHAGTIPTADEAKVWLNSFDLNADGKITREEFRTGMTRWLAQMEAAERKQNAQRMLSRGSATKMEEAQRILTIAALEAEEDEEEEEEEEEGEEGGALVFLKAGALIFGGLAIVATFADPAVGAIGRFSDAAGFNPFYVAFIATPFASNASEVVSSYLFAKKKRLRNISLTYSQIYGAVTMNNTVCLGIFLAVVYLRGLTWDFSAEVTTNVVVILAMALIGRSSTTFPSWTALPAITLYPLSIGLIAYLETSLGWH